MKCLQTCRHFMETYRQMLQRLTIIIIWLTEWAPDQTQFLKLVWTPRIWLENKSANIAHSQKKNPRYWYFDPRINRRITTCTSSKFLKALFIIFEWNFAPKRYSSNIRTGVAKYSFPLQIVISSPSRKYKHLTYPINVVFEVRRQQLDPFNRSVCIAEKNLKKYIFLNPIKESPYKDYSR